MLCRYLYKSNSQGVQDYLCNRLYTLPEDGVEGYLLQLVYLVLQRPRTSLERVLIDLCARSLRIAAKVTPRLCRRSVCGARSEQPRSPTYPACRCTGSCSRTRKTFRERNTPRSCGTAARRLRWTATGCVTATPLQLHRSRAVPARVEAHSAVSRRLILAAAGWVAQEPPFKNPRLPNSPQRGFNFLSPPLSPTGSVNSVFSPQGPRCGPACGVQWLPRASTPDPGQDSGASHVFMMS